LQARCVPQAHGIARALPCTSQTPGASAHLV